MFKNMPKQHTPPPPLSALEVCMDKIIKGP